MASSSLLRGAALISVAEKSVPFQLDGKRGLYNAIGNTIRKGLPETGKITSGAELVYLFMAFEPPGEDQCCWMTYIASSVPRQCAGRREDGYPVRLKQLLCI